MQEEKSLNSSIKIDSSNKFGNGTVIGHNNKVTINQNNTVEYQGDKEDSFVLKRVSPYLIKKYGEKNIRFSGLISLTSGLITILSWFGIFPFVSNFKFIHSSFFFYLGMFLFLVASLLLGISSYYESRKCKRCNREFAYEEYKDPSIQEIKTSKGVRRMTTRYYKCKFCGNEDTKNIKETVDNEKKRSNF
mgnify:CR=1 FL=1